MKWVRIISLAIFVLFLLIALVSLIGLMLPKAHRATRMASFRQSPQAVFAAITGPQDWRRGIAVVELQSENGHRRWREDSSHRSVTFEETASDAPRLYEARIVGEHLPFGGTWTWQITPTSDGCTCRIIEDGEVYNPIFRFMGRFVVGYTATMETYLNEMGKKFGDTVEIRP